jgi:anti-anti-sigma factor
VIILDFAQVELIDAKGLGVLLELRELMHSRGTEFRLMNVTGLVQQVLEITRLNSVFDTSLDIEITAQSAGHSTTVSA